MLLANIHRNGGFLDIHLATHILGLQSAPYNQLQPHPELQAPHQSQPQFQPQPQVQLNAPTQQLSHVQAPADLSSQNQMQGHQLPPVVQPHGQAMVNPYLSLSLILILIHHFNLMSLQP
ncbi:hypothetical protein VNO77_25319 [Canavalia gladiata]|uniref:Uncharacterized protein n=1 Tax=Canavalia gladiata TaxID=3824 RepID=A0AAN9L7X1_CANGL